MLLFLKIRDFALIRELEIEFDRGLNLLTGETGSGKSIIVDALGLLLGSRSSQDMIRSNCDLAVLEGIFEFDQDSSLRDLLEKAGLAGDDNEVLIRREIAASGRNRIFINNGACSLALLKPLGEMLADIHGQHDQRSLLELAAHREWLDRFGGNGALRTEVRTSYRKLRNISEQIESIHMDEQERLRRMEILQFQLDEIRSAGLRCEEKIELENEQNILRNRERIFALATEAYAILYESDTALLTQATRVEKILQELETYDSRWIEHKEALRDSFFKWEDLAYAARDYVGSVDFTPERLGRVQQRLFDIDRLEKKYGPSFQDIQSHADKCEKELAMLSSYADTSKTLSEQFSHKASEYRARAGALSEKRAKDAARLEDEIKGEFAALAMERMELTVKLVSGSDLQEDGKLPSGYGPEGVDHVEFLVAPNKGEEMRPLARIASGGELSRIMLAIKSLCGSADKGRTLVFDEVDAGIGGRVAEAVGRRLQVISGDNQVLCVTHLPQIAAFARQHYCVRKEVVAGRTETMINQLDSAQRIHEVARMLGGATITETTRKHAREMIEQAARKSRPTIPR